MDRQETEALTRLRDAVLSGPLQAYRAGVAFGPDAAAHEDGTQDPARLAEPHVFGPLLARFCDSYPGGDCPASVSLWSQFYFSSLVIPLMALFLRADRPLRLDMRTMRVRFCPSRGLPLCFHLSGGPAACSGDALVRALFDHQVAPTVAALKRHGGLSARLLWENAGWYTAWILGEMTRTCPDVAPAAEALLRDAEWPAGAGRVVAPLKCAALECRPATRRMCCLRYRLDGFGRCPGTCPLGEEAGSAH